MITPHPKGPLELTPQSSGSREHLPGEALPSAPGVLSTARVTITAAVQRPLGICRATIPDIIESKGRSNGSQHSSNPVDLVNSLHRIKVYGRSHVWQDWRVPRKETNQHWSWNTSSVPGQTIIFEGSQSNAWHCLHHITLNKHFRWRFSLSYKRSEDWMSQEFKERKEKVTQK